MRNKNQLNSMKRNYFKVPCKIYEMGLSLTAIGIYTYLAKQSEEFNPAISVISRSLGISKNTVIKYIKELKDRNILMVVQPGAENLITKYAFVHHKDWVGVAKIETEVKVCQENVP